jgi:uncharacterized protein YutE (UPF0331/DUF86 family)
VTDRDLLGKKLATIESSVEELRSFADPTAIYGDIREERFIKYTLQIAIQAMLDTASHIVSDERLGEPETNRGMIDILERHGWVPTDLAQRLRNMVGFRNILVHGYDVVDLGIVESIVTSHLDDLLIFVQAIRKRLAST